MTLKNGTVGKAYVVRHIDLEDQELQAFLFSLGCYTGETVTLVARRNHGIVVSIKDSRYSMDAQLAEAIGVEEGIFS